MGLGCMARRWNLLERPRWREVESRRFQFTANDMIAPHRSNRETFVRSVATLHQRQSTNANHRYITVEFDRAPPFKSISCIISDLSCSIPISPLWRRMKFLYRSLLASVSFIFVLVNGIVASCVIQSVQFSRNFVSNFVRVSIAFSCDLSRGFGDLQRSFEGFQSFYGIFRTDELRQFYILWRSLRFNVCINFV